MADDPPERRWSVDDLPAFSPWPARLLGIEPWSARVKSRAEVLREYETEKWRGLLEAAEMRGGLLTLAEADELFLPDEPQLHLVRGEFELLTAAAGYDVYLDLLEEVVGDALTSGVLVELGAGYGRVSLGLACRHSGRSVAPAELTAAGRAVIEIIASTEGLDAVVQPCDLASAAIMATPAPGAVVLTSFAACYEQLGEAFVRTVSSWQPKLVVHLEPVLAHFEPTTLLGLLQRRYLEVNGYHADLLDILTPLEAQGVVEIVDVVPALYGGNPLLPASAILWRPAGA